MPKNPSSTWYFNDWENDPALKTCSLAAQGLWKRLLCIAARSLEHGVVQIEGRTSSLPHGLAHLASAVGRPLEEIAPLIDELLSSGTASRDRKGRLFCRRMVRAAGLSPKRAKAGKLGAEATHGKKRETEGLPSKDVGKPLAPSRLHDYESSSQEPSPIIAARAAASPDGPPRTRLPDAAIWAERLAGYEPWNGRHRWIWGPPPDAVGARNPSLTDHQLETWKAKRDAAGKSA